MPLPFPQHQIERALAPVVGNQAFEIRELLAGNINTIIRVVAGGQHYGLRIRTQEQIYRYDPDLIKEAFVAWLFANSQQTVDVKAMATTFAQLRTKRYGTTGRSNCVLPMLRYYDWSRQHVPYPYCVYEWIDGIPLWDTPTPRLYALAGRMLARIHTVRFPEFYTDFTSLGLQAVRWDERLRVAWEKELRTARLSFPFSLTADLDRLTLPLSVTVSPCLVHNDFAPGNILVRDESVAGVIDWDNAVIDVPHLDFVKMKYWTMKDENGKLSPAPEYFRSFVDGYGPAGQAIVSSSLFALYEILWLLRVYNFEHAKEEQGLSRAPGYPAASIYTEHLVNVLTRTLS
ncbi:MAG: phosphotransferase family protein [Candidatus Binatia bacterium]